MKRYLISLSMILWCITIASASETIVVKTYYDPIGRLVRAEYNGAKYISYKYTAGGVLISRNVGLPQRGDIVTDSVIDLTDAIAVCRLLAGEKISDLGLLGVSGNDGKICTEDVLYILQRISEIRQE
jgi:hypothetical protein